MRRGILLVVAGLVLVSAACDDKDGDPLAGYAERPLAVHAADGTSHELRVLVADTERLRAHGLMGVTDLAPYDGMLFVFDEDTSARFWMKDTLLPLSIAFIDQAGALVSATDMDPCPPDESQCPVYSAAGPYRYALEVEQGGLAALGLGVGSTVEVRPPEGR